MQIESNHKVPQTNRLSLDVLDMDAKVSEGYTNVSQHFQISKVSKDYQRFQKHVKCCVDKLLTK